jgi:p-cumate 2,3-dioxygenase beta subunit
VRRANEITRSEVEDFLFAEAELLDSWRLEEWLGLLTDDATYLVPSNDAPEGDPRATLFTIADDIRRIRGRVKRLSSHEAHAEYPRSRTHRIVGNVRILSAEGDALEVAANFIVHRFRRDERVGAYVGRYFYRLMVTTDGLRIASRKAVLDSEELGGLGSVSFIL